MIAVRTETFAIVQFVIVSARPCHLLSLAVVALVLAVHARVDAATRLHAPLNITNITIVVVVVQHQKIRIIIVVIHEDCSVLWVVGGMIGGIL